MRGRSIFDNISLTRNLCEIGKRDGLPNLGLNLDMHKAYDQLEWDFLFKVLHRFGFCDAWVQLIRACVSECHFSIVLQGQVKGFIASSCEVLLENFRI